MKSKRFNRFLKWVNNYVAFFLMVAFVITCCTMLFVTVLSRTLGATLTGDNLATAARITFANVIFISLLFTLIDGLRRKYTVERPAKRIIEGAEKIMQGDFDVRIEPQSRFAADDNFNKIIECFNKMAEELNSVETLRTDFVANVSHEMKTPMAVMQNYGTLLQAADLPEEKRIEYAKGVTDASHRMADMLTNILKLNRLENQQIFPKTSEFDLGEQLCQCLLQFEALWEDSNIEIETHIAESIRVKADEELLSLVWNNLFSNAFKFTNPGGRVTVTLEETENYAIVKVKDTGCGMSPETGAHIFEKFYQGDTSRSTRGNGLGLALVKRVIDIMQGEISVESSLGVGSVFTVKIQKQGNSGEK